MQRQRRGAQMGRRQRSTAGLQRITGSQDHSFTVSQLRRFLGPRGAGRRQVIDIKPVVLDGSTASQLHSFTAANVNRLFLSWRDEKSAEMAGRSGCEAPDHSPTLSLRQPRDIFCNSPKENCGDSKADPPAGWNEDQVSRCFPARMRRISSIRCASSFSRPSCVGW